MAAGKPIDGASGAGRKFYLERRRAALKWGFEESELMKSLYVYRENGQIVSLMAVHVDDILWATVPGNGEAPPLEPKETTRTPTATKLFGKNRLWTNR